ncbi:hypothetical protein [Butyrivibrio fibrisolvens]|uniref:hypothetical protein n=1 Tax=Butyrivibrio fibrisolvens TaxID=831 RepID=UPI0020BE6CE6|nr:hypothetical protein [Butyrivibrio fibrisolvens]
MEDKSGIYSLGGFAFQILVLAIYIPFMRSGDFVSFETIDDVETNLKQEELDNKENLLNVSRIGTNKRTSIQVKKTSINHTKAKKIVKNWMIAEIENNDIDKFCLITDRSDTDKKIFKKVLTSEIVDEILNENDKKTNSINNRIKAYKYSENELEKICNKVKSKSEVKILSNIEAEVKKAYDSYLIASSVYEYTYIERIRQFLSNVAFNILECVIKGNPYTLRYEDAGKIQNNVITSINDEHFEPSFSQFQRVNKINLSDLAIANTREYKQLCECKLEEDSIMRHLIYGEYYANCRLRYYEAGKVGLVDDIEVTAHDNFCNAKDGLKYIKKDTPRNRLDKTKELPNGYAKNDQIKYGVCIGLTKDGVDPGLQISWKD